MATKRSGSIVKFDGEVDDEALDAKESEYRANIAEIKAIINGLLKGNPEWYENASRTLELANRLPELYDRANQYCPNVAFVNMRN